MSCRTANFIEVVLCSLMRRYALWCDTGKVSDMPYSLEEDLGGRYQ